MRLAAASHQRLELFFRDYLREENFRLPALEISAGKPVGWLTGVLQIGGITFGRRVLLAPHLLRRDRAGRLRAPGWLVAHEAMHVIQYMQAGFAPFLWLYLRQYLGGLSGMKGGILSRHRAAYHAIAFEREACAAEAAYGSWLPGGDAKKTGTA